MKKGDVEVEDWYYAMKGEDIVVVENVFLNEVLVSHSYYPYTGSERDIQGYFPLPEYTDKPTFPYQSIKRHPMLKHLLPTKPTTSN